MSQIEQNTTGLQAILAAVNALPEAGSGGGGISLDGISAIDCGTYTPTFDVTFSPLVNHNMGVAPNLVVAIALGDVTTFSKTGTFFFVAFNKSKLASNTSTPFQGMCATYTPSNASWNFTGQKMIFSLSGYSETQVTIGAGTNYPLLKGQTYMWIAAKIDNMI